MDMIVSKPFKYLCLPAVLMSLIGCTTQAQMAVQTEWAAWNELNELAAIECGDGVMSVDEYDTSYTPNNIKNREQCELTIMREVVQPKVVHAQAYKDLLAEVKANNNKFAKKLLDYDEWWSEQELVAMVYSQKVEAWMMPRHNAELAALNQGLEDFGHGLQSARQPNQPTQTSCYQMGNYINCNHY